MRKSKLRPKVPSHPLHSGEAAAITSYLEHGESRCTAANFPAPQLLLPAICSARYTREKCKSLAKVDGAKSREDLLQGSETPQGKGSGYN